jgi:hypothetical protein
MLTLLRNIYRLWTRRCLDCCAPITAAQRLRFFNQCPSCADRCREYRL